MSVIEGSNSIWTKVSWPSLTVLLGALSVSASGHTKKMDATNETQLLKLCDKISISGSACDKTVNYISRSRDYSKF